MESDEKMIHVSKGQLWTGRVLSALPVLFMFGLAAVMQFNIKAMHDGMQKYGYPPQDARAILTLEMTCALIYAIPQTSVLGAILLTGYLGGATATHVRVGEPPIMPAVVGIVVWLGLWFRDARIRALVPWRR